MNTSNNEKINTNNRPHQSIFDSYRSYFTGFLGQQLCQMMQSFFKMGQNSLGPLAPI